VREPEHESRDYDGDDASEDAQSSDTEAAVEELLGKGY
jgi:hypothetical protein